MREWVACSAMGLIWPSLDHSWITHSRKRTGPRGHRRTRSPGHLSSGGPQRSRQDIRGHGADTVRDREAPGSNPGPPTNSEFKIGDFSGRLTSPQPSAPGANSVDATDRRNQPGSLSFIHSACHASGGSREPFSNLAEDRIGRQSRRLDSRYEAKLDD